MRFFHKLLGSCKEGDKREYGEENRESIDESVPFRV